MKNRILSFFAVPLFFFFLSFPAHAVNETPEQTQNPPAPNIIWVSDASGSSLAQDPSACWKEAVSLGIELAPANSQVEYITVSNEILGKTGLLPVSESSNRVKLREALQDADRLAYTDFALGIETALQSLKETGIEQPSHIFLIGDISEGGFALPSELDMEELTRRIGGLSQLAKESGTRVHLLFYGQPPEDSPLLPSWSMLAQTSGGSIHYHETPEELTESVEKLYFENFSFHKFLVTSLNSSDENQSVTVETPTGAIQSARAFVSSRGPLNGLQARVDGGDIDIVQGRSYAVLDFPTGVPQRFELVIPPTGGEKVYVYLIANYHLATQADIQVQWVIEPAESGGETRQEALFKFRAVSEETGTPLFTGTLPDGIACTLYLTFPDGTQDVQPLTDFDGSYFRYSLTTGQHGAYRARLEISLGGNTLASSETEVVLPAAPLPTVENSIDWALVVAIVTGALLIVAAIIFALYRKRKLALQAASGYETASELVSSELQGKLDIYPIILEGGKLEIPSATCYLDRYSASRELTLQQALSIGGIPYQFEEAKSIFIRGMDGQTIQVQNDSPAAILASGRKYTKGQRLRLSFGQKMYIVIQDGETEFEIYYHSSLPRPDGSSSSIQIHG